MGNMLATAISIGILLFGIIGTVLIAIFGKKKPGKISAAGVFTGIIMILATICQTLVLVRYGSMQYYFSVVSIEGILYLLSLLAFVAIAVFAFAKLRPAFMAIPLGVILLQEFGFLVNYCKWTFQDIDYILDDFEYAIDRIFSLSAHLLMIIALIVMFITAFTSMKKRGFGIAAGIISAIVYFEGVTYWPVSDFFMMINEGEFDIETLLWSVVYDHPYYIFALALLPLGITMFKTSPKADKKICKCEEAPVVSEVVQEEAPGVIEESAAEEAVMEPVQETADQDTVEEPVQEEAAEAIQEHIEEETKEPEYVPATHGDTDKVAQDLSAYKKMLDDGLITEADFEAKKKQILGL